MQHVSYTVSEKETQRTRNTGATMQVTHVAKVEDIFVVVLIEAKIQTEFSKAQPLVERVEEDWFIVVQTEVGLAAGDWQDIRIIAVGTQVFPIQKVHGCWARHGLGTITTTFRWWNTGLQFSSCIMGAVSKVCQTKGMVVVFILSLQECVSDADLDSQSWIHSIAAFDVEIPCTSTQRCVS